ncbi:MAG: sugar ABC transporter permease [Caldilineaceae bacterium]|nr:sugar ABC transporter permease [Caldilineaceae bacterium]MCB0095591.1 sugar ABC transporter permease [Caldilineaceae bacterium]MCB9156482.1 sugar ABC transporter permease [Caldilineaceae bacterium]
MVSLIPQGKLARKEAMWFWFFIMPWILGFIFFRGLPILVSMYLSFTQYNVASPPAWIGLENYTNLFNDRIFYQSLKVSAYYTFLSVPIGLIFSLGLAMLLNQRVPFLGLFRTFYYMPSLIVGSVSVAFLFQLLLNPAFGFVNYFISWLLGPEGLIPLGIQGPGWFFDPKWVVPSFVLLSLWGFGGPMLIYLAGLQGVPTALYEAARIDGANAWQRFRNVTIPMISPVILFTFITGIIGSFQVFTPAYIVSNGEGGPAYSSMFYVLYLYLNAFRRYRYGYSSAQAWILFLVILLLTILAFRFSRESVYYESPGDEQAS